MSVTLEVLRLVKSNYFNKTGKYMLEIIFKDNITNCNGLFDECPNIISLDFTNFNTSNVTDMLYMFNECYKLK